ncbi:MAG: autotransporter outer membrane beta-barrel domain-containing protein [Helicobacter apodemus]|nr:autotransporter outer membrane beta-barrel domain-containing protein [Helicobacter apodemus]
MGISSISSKALISFGILGAISAYAVDITNSQDFTNNFRSNNGNWSVKADSKIKSEGVTIKGALTQLQQPINTITLTTDKKVTIEKDIEIGYYTDKDKKDKFYSLNISAKEGVENGGEINILRDSKITANTTLQNISVLSALASKLDIIGDVVAENNSIINLATLTNEDINIIHIFKKLNEEKVTLTTTKKPDSSIANFDEEAIRIANALSDTSTLKTGILNIRGNFTTKGSTIFGFYNDGFINVSGKATINSKSDFEIITNNNPLSDDKTLLFAKEGVDIVETNNTSILQQQSDKTWKPSNGAKLNVTYDRQVASYLSKPSLLDGIFVDAVEDLKNDNYIYELRVDEKKNNIFVKVNVNNSKINTASLKDPKTIDDFLKNQLTTLSVGEKKNLETAKKNLENAKQIYNQTNISNKAQIIKNIEEALKDIEGKIQATNTFNNTNTTTKDILNVLVKGADTSVAENVLVTLVNKKDNKLFSAALDAATLKDTTTSISQSGNTQEALSILNALSTSNINTNDVLSAITHENFFKDTRTQGQVATQTSNTSSQLGAINVANDMAIGDRIARFNNPYIETKRFAALSSDAAYNYYDEYKSSLWANAFGGLNIIGDNDGGFYGITAGIDRNINTNLLLGGYFTYANSTLKSITNKQQSNNYQLGLYTLIKFAQDWEVVGKAYTQLSPTNQYDYNPLGTDSADFTRRLFGFNGGIGKVFQISNAFFIKPFGGVNYYYSFTPNYAQSGTALAKKIRSLTNNALSLEAGLEARQYFGANSYFYLTPKLEQYVVNNGDDYIARFAGSTSVFKISNDEKKKTYGQLTFGGNVYIKENLSLNIGGGIKQILAGKSNSANETYLSINTGLKYKF